MIDGDSKLGEILSALSMDRPPLPFFKKGDRVLFVTEPAILKKRVADLSEDTNSVRPILLSGPDEAHRFWLPDPLDSRSTLSPSSLRDGHQVYYLSVELPVDLMNRFGIWIFRSSNGVTAPSLTRATPSGGPDLNVLLTRDRMQI